MAVFSFGVFRLGLVFNPTDPDDTAIDIFQQWRGTLAVDTVHIFAHCCFDGVYRIVVADRSCHAQCCCELSAFRCTCVMVCASDFSFVCVSVALPHTKQLVDISGFR
ncbi:unnamed protein product [Polarella glacialis]|uniref:Uncharacterized protein n=1 Tax=Polarella glacialis TaxID=89957 RepID=A0A813FQ03_POLGL|nr:unnamed protein product [Polarella glacialis]